MRKFALTAMCATTAVVLLAGLSPVANAAEITWDGGGDGGSTFQEANWVVTVADGALTGVVGDPPAGFVDGSVDVLADVVVGGTGTAGGAIGAGNHFDLGSGFSLTVSDDASFRMQLESFGGGPRGIRGVAGGAAETLTIEDNAAVFSQFLLDITASMTGASTLTLGGGGVGTLNNSTVDLATDWTGSITWNNFNVAGSGIFSSITVGGLAAVEGVNVLVAGSGESGSILTVIPEPGSVALIGIGMFAMLAGRRRDRK